MVNKNLYGILMIIVGLLLLVCCEYKPTGSKSASHYLSEINQSLSSSDIEKSVYYYEKYTQIKNSQDFSILNKIALKVSQEIFSGKVNFNKKIDILLLINSFYKRVGVPFIGEKVGTEKLADKIEVQKKLAKAVVAYNLYLADKKEYMDAIVPLIKDPDPSVRGVVAACLSGTDSPKYLPRLRDTFYNDSVDYVRFYALKGLGFIDFKNYKSEVVKLLNSDDDLGKTIAAGILLYNNDNSGLGVLKGSLNSGNEILILRTLEGLILKKLVLDEKKVTSFLRSDSFLRSLYAARLLAVSKDDKYLKILKREFNGEQNTNKLTLSMGLLLFDDYSGIDYIVKGMCSENYVERIFAARAIIEYCKESGKCSNTNL